MKITFRHLLNEGIFGRPPAVCADIRPREAAFGAPMLFFELVALQNQRERERFFVELFG